MGRCETNKHVQSKGGWHENQTTHTLGPSSVHCHGLLIANTLPAFAGGGKGGDDYIGEISVSVTYPPEGSDAAFSLPGGGTATATAGLSWTASRMDGIARSSLSSDTVGTYTLCARVENLYMDSAPQGGYTIPVCGDRIAGGSVTQTKSKIVASVFGHTWQVNTRHDFTRPGWGGWHPALQAGPISL